MGRFLRAAGVFLSFVLVSGCQPAADSTRGGPKDQASASPTDGQAKTPAAPAEATASTSAADPSAPPLPPPLVESKLKAVAAASDPPRFPPVPADAPKAAPIAIREVDLAGYHKTVAQAEGRMVAVDFWATWCVDCCKKFPTFLELSKTYPREKIIFMSVATDEENLEDPLAFLQKNGADIVNLRLTGDLFEHEKALGFEGIPHYLLYDTEGKRVLSVGHVEELAAKLAQTLGSPPAKQ